MKISELLGKPLISLAEAGVEGIIKDVIFDNKLRRAKFLILFDDKNESEEKAVPTSAILSHGYDALVIRNNAAVVGRDSICEQGNNPASKSVFNTQGKVVGRITDIELDAKLNVVNLELDKGGKLDTKDIAAFSEELLIVFEGKRFKLVRAVPAPMPKDKLVTASILPIDYPTPLASQVPSNAPAQVANNSAPPSQSTAHTLSAVAPSHSAPTTEQVYTHKQVTHPTDFDDDPEHNPQRIIGNYAFLLGRTVTGDVCNQRGEVIVAQGSAITPETVENARKYGRLVELTLHSL